MFENCNDFFSAEIYLPTYRLHEKYVFFFNNYVSFSSLRICSCPTNKIIRNVLPLSANVKQAYTPMSHLHRPRVAPQGWILALLVSSRWCYSTHVASDNFVTSSNRASVPLEIWRKYRRKRLYFCFDFRFKVAESNEWNKEQKKNNNNWRRS